MASRESKFSGAAPPSVSEIVQQAESFEYNAHIPLRYWLQSANTIQKEAQIYEREGNQAQTYLLLYRHAVLVLEKLSQHPEAKEKQNRIALSKANRLVQQDLDRLTKLKASIEQRHKKYAVYAAQHAPQSIHRESLDIGISDSTINHNENLSTNENSSTALPRKRTLEAVANKDMATRLAEKESLRRDVAKRSSRVADNLLEEAHPHPTEPWARPRPEHRNARPEDFRDEDEISRRMQEISLQRDHRGDVQDRQNARMTSDLSSVQYHYPQIPQKSPHVAGNGSSLPDPFLQSPIVLPTLPPRVPLRPPKESDNHSKYSSAPPRPEKIPSHDIASPTSQSRSGTPLQDLNAQDYTFKPSAYLENGTPLRTVFINPNLRHKFLAVAASNTKRNLETCGILCGTLISNALFISKLVIPEQESTSDTCETVNEGALFDHCDSEDLMILGWIHTHPSQTCFMSSRDLHTHCGYQVMMAESIAIVCAPSKDPSWGIFRLTDPPGMKSIQQCHQSGLFHPHAEHNIYTDALRPGHVHELPGLTFEVADLRPKHLR